MNVMNKWINLSCHLKAPTSDRLMVPRVIWWKKMAKSSGRKKDDIFYRFQSLVWIIHKYTLMSFLEVMKKFGWTNWIESRNARFTVSSAVNKTPSRGCTGLNESFNLMNQCLSIPTVVWERDFMGDNYTYKVTNAHLLIPFHFNRLFFQLSQN